MKVILIKDVKKVGRKYETKEVSAGYATNFLIPRKLAEISTESTIKRIHNLKARDEGERKIQEDLLMKNLKSVDSKTVNITAPANDKGHLFKGIHADEIVTAVKEQTELDLAPEYIVLEKPIKEVGEHEIEVKVQDKSVKFKLVVSAE